MMTSVFQRLIAIVLMVWMGSSACADRLTVFAAASLKTALDDVAHVYETHSGEDVVVSYGGSSALARQIQQGAPADLYLSANPGWMDVLQDDGLIVEESRINLLSNTLVLIGSEPQSLTLSSDLDLVGLLNGHRLAMALVSAVPAGIYGKAALTSLGLWQAVEPHVAQTDNVRAALRLVSLGEAPFGIVYATDARADPNVFVLDSFPAETHPEILYPVAVLREGQQTAAERFLDFLTSHTARMIFDRHGFSTPGGPE